MASRPLPAAFAVVLLAAAPSSAQEPVFCPLYHFGTRPNDPIWPQEIGRVAVGPDGNLYGTSTSGGARNLGTIFKISPSGDLSVLWEFDGLPTGAGPQGGLIDGRDGYFYGTTYMGGKFSSGTLYRLAYGASKPEVLYHFRNGNMAGLTPPGCPTQPYCPFSPQQRADAAASFPISTPVIGSDGRLHGVTGYSNNQQYGTIYSIAPNGGADTFNVSCLFQPGLAFDKDMKQFVCTPKSTNAAVLIRGNETSTYYGTTFGGFGSVFKLFGGDVSILHEFQFNDGSKPLDLMQASDNVLYGTTLVGGVANWGVVYRLDPATNAFKVIYEFKPSATPTGAVPVAGLAEGRDGNLYGVTKWGGLYGRGVVFRMAKDGSNFAVLHHFTLYGTGRSPVTTPEFVGGDLYGTTYQGGTYDKGVFYRLNIDQPAMTGGDVLSNSDPMVEVRAHVRAAQGTNDSSGTSDGIAVRLACKDRPHFVQFLYRERIGYDGIALGGEVSNSFGTYTYTTDPAHPVWNPDARAKPSPYFESGHSARWDCNGLTLFDQPSLAPSFGLDGSREIWRATARDYLMCGGKVVRQVQWVAERRYGAPTTYSASVQNADAIPREFLDLLVRNGYSLP